MLNAKSEEFQEKVRDKLKSYNELIITACLSGCAGLRNVKFVRSETELDALFEDCTNYFRPKALIGVYRADKVKNNMMYVGSGNCMDYVGNIIDGDYLYKEPVVLVCEEGLVPDVDGELRKGSY